MDLGTIFFNPFLRELIQKTVDGGIPAEFFSVLLVLPFLTTIIALSRHLLGLTTYGVFLPAMISAVWLATGLEAGLLISGLLLVWTWLAYWLTRKVLVGALRISYLPRMSVLLAIICWGVLLLELFEPLGSFFKLQANFFPFLALIVIVQNLVETQISLSKKEGREMMRETAVFAILGYFILSWQWLQRLVLFYPGWSVVVLLAVNLYIGRYVGFRLLEYQRFHSLVEKKERDD